MNIPEEIKVKITSEANWRSTNGHGGVDDVTRDNFIQAAEFGYSLAKQEISADEYSIKALTETIKQKNEEIEKYVGATKALLEAAGKIEYWKKRCEAAERVIKIFPIKGHYFNTNDTEKEQAYDHWQHLKNSNPE